MALALVNTASGSDYSGGSASALTAGATSVSAGNLLVVAARYYDPSDTVSVNSVTDTAGNSYSRVTGQHFPATDGTDIELWYAENTSAHASNVVSFNLSSSVQFWGVVTAQYSGAATSGALDTSAAGAASSATTVTSGTFTTSQNDEVLIAVADHDGPTTTTWTAGSGYTIQVQDAGQVLALEDQIVSSIQSGVTASMDISSARNLNILVGTFKQAGGGGGATWPGYQSPFGWR